MDQNRTVYSVSDLNRDVKALLGKAFPLMWIQGEISNLTVPSSGHWYFTLKDDKAQIRAAMFKQRNRYLKIKPTHGMEVLVRARVSLYEPRGDYQLIVEDMEEAGAGALQRAFEQLKEKLQQKGLFSPDHKLTLPAQPRKIGVITSPTGAAIQDILSVLSRRAPHIPVVVYPVPVQGEDAANKIARMIHKACLRAECDVLVLARGGGSLEDLWSFNEEIVAQAIFDADIPIVCGVGHEIDFTIADFVADIRAPTPSAAAELIALDRNEQLNTIRILETRLVTATKTMLQRVSQQLMWQEKRLVHPRQTLQDHAQRLDELELRLKRSIHGQRMQKSLYLKTISTRLEQHSPERKLAQFSLKQITLQKQLKSLMKQFLHEQHNQLGKLAHTLNAVSPLATLQRGYAIVTKSENNQLVRNASEVEVGDKIKTRLGSGDIISTVEDRHLE